MPSDPELSLPDEVVEHVEFEADIVRRAAQTVALAGPLCLVGLTYVEQNSPIVAMASALTESDRARKFDEVGEQALWSLWCPADWPTQLDGHIVAKHRPRYPRVARVARAVLRRHGVRDPHKRIHQEIARSLGVPPARRARHR